MGRRRARRGDGRWVYHEYKFQSTPGQRNVFEMMLREDIQDLNISNDVINVVDDSMYTLSDAGQYHDLMLVRFVRRGAILLGATSDCMAGASRWRWLWKI